MRSISPRHCLPLFLVCAAVAAVPPAAGQPWESTEGKLLVALPSMPDPRFRRTIVYMAAHTRRGALGFVVNRIAGRRPLRQVLRRFGLPETGVRGGVTLHYGGPVGLNRSTVLHESDYRHARSVRLKGGVFVTPPRKVFGDISRRRGPKRYLLVVGRSGWSSGQLEREIRQGTWAVIPFDRELVFGRDQRGKWRKALERRGVDL